MNAFIISFDDQTTPIYPAHNAIISAVGVVEWWHFLSGTYIITTNLSLVAVKKNIEAKWPGGMILIMKASRQTGGALPKEAWDWINTRVAL